VENRKRQIDLDREQRRDQMRQRILGASMRLFVRRGFENVTMRNIATEIGFSPATIYRYFNDKDEIFFALRGEGFEKFHRRQLTERKSDDPAVRLREHAGAYVGFALENREYYEIMFLMRAPIERVLENEEWGATVQTLDLLRDDLQSAHEAGVIEVAEPGIVELTFWSMLHGILSLVLSKRLAAHSSLPDDELVTQVVDSFLAAFLDDN
jgi:AcrR family transcriptional regulator